MFKLIVWFFSHVPLPIAWLFSWSIAWLWWTVLPVRKAIAVDNFSQVFPDLPVGSNLRRSTAELVMGYIELFHELRRPCIQLTVENAEEIHERLAMKKPMIMLTGHCGSWDLVGAMVSRQESLPVSAVVKDPSWKPAADFIAELRDTFGLGTLPAHDSFPAIMHELENGRIVGFLLDQRYRKGIPVSFFGRPAWTTPVLSVAAERSGVPVYGLLFYREGVGKHRARFSGPLKMVGDIERDTTTAQVFYEECIRERPHSWLWMHDRWKKPKSGIVAKFIGGKRVDVPYRNVNV